MNDADSRHGGDPKFGFFAIVRSDHLGIGERSSVAQEMTVGGLQLNGRCTVESSPIRIAVTNA
jgi:hypothetical protein